MGIDLEALRDDGKLFIEQMDAAEVSPGEFAHPTDFKGMSSFG
jgi:circadian clock protein KaiC